MAEGFRVAATPVLTGGGSPNGSATVTIPTAIQTGDLIYLVFFATVTGGSTINAPTGGLGGWTQLDQKAGTNVNAAVFYKIAAGTPGSASTDGGTSVTVSNAAATGKCELHCLAYAGVDGNVPILTFSSQFTATSPNVTTFTTPTVSTTIDGCMTLNIVLVKSSTFGATWTLPAGYVARSTALWASGSGVTDGVLFDDNKNNDLATSTSSTTYGGQVATISAATANAYVCSISMRPATVKIEPASDASNPGNWVATPSGSLFAAIDEDPIVTSQYVTSPAVPSAATFTDNLATAPSPGLNIGWAFEIEAAYLNGASGSVVVTLFNGATQVAQWTVTLTTVATSYLLALTSTQAAGIQGSSSLSFSVAATAS